MTFLHRTLLTALLASSTAMPAFAAGDGRVVATIKPLHSLVAGVMQGDGVPDLLVDGGASEHDFVLKPSQMEMLQDADLVFYIGDDLETFLAESLSAIPQEVKVVSMEKSADIKLLPTRKAIRGDTPQDTEEDETASGASWSNGSRAIGGVSNNFGNNNGWSSSGGAQLPANSATAQLAQQWQDRQRQRYTSTNTNGGSYAANSGSTFSNANSGASPAARNAQWLEQAAKGNYGSNSSSNYKTGATTPSMALQAPSMMANNYNARTRAGFSTSSSIAERQRAYKENGGYPMPDEAAMMAGEEGFLSPDTVGREARKDDHDHAKAESEHSHGRYDLHIWLNPENAKHMVDAIAAALIKTYPANKALYERNANDMKTKIDAQWRQLYNYLSPLKGKRFITFHDAYQYFETSYGLESAGSISLHPGQAPGARRMAKLRDAMRDYQVKCVFAEPQYDDSVIESLVEGMQVRTGMLDPLGSNLKNGPDLYFELNAQLAGQFGDCLAR